MPVKVKVSDKVDFRVIGRDEYADWFLIDASDENASAKCGISSVAIEYQDKVLTKEDSPLPFVNKH